MARKLDTRQAVNLLLKYFDVGTLAQLSGAEPDDLYRCASRGEGRITDAQTSRLQLAKDAFLIIAESESEEVAQDWLLHGRVGPHDMSPVHAIRSDRGRDVKHAATDMKTVEFL